MSAPRTFTPPLLDPNNPDQMVADLQQALEDIASVLNALGLGLFSGNGSPEGVVTAPVSSTYRRLNGGASTSFYVKESGTGNTGWAAK